MFFGLERLKGKRNRSRGREKKKEERIIEDNYIVEWKLKLKRNKTDCRRKISW
jgi:hypothetical protein